MVIVAKIQLSVTLRCLHNISVMFCQFEEVLMVLFGPPQYSLGGCIAVSRAGVLCVTSEEAPFLTAQSAPTSASLPNQYMRVWAAE